MNMFRRIFYEFQYAKYVRQLPFYLMRHFGKRDHYKTKDIDFILKKYSFGVRFSPIAYALLGKPEEFEKASLHYAPHPSREHILGKVVSRYYKGGEQVNLYTLMQRSMFKSCEGGDSGPSASKEYWAQMAKFDKTNS